MLRSLLVLLLIASAAAALGGWIVSPEMAENWAFHRYGTPESVREARAGLWLLRVLGPLACIALGQSLRRWPRTERTLRALACDFLAATQIAPGNAFSHRWRRGVLRAGVAAWLLLAAVHWTAGARRAVQEWPVYRLRSGDQVLPNMSESNRDVIRYLAAATPDDARILAASDQTLFFLSYYLWPREILQRRHPDSEFTVPQPGRQLAAYRLSDLASEDIAAIDPDFVLEYFEGPQYVEPDRLLEDAGWIAFARQLHADPQYVPPFNVRLRPVGDVERRP